MESSGSLSSLEDEVGGVYSVPFGATEWALRVRALGHEVLSSKSRAIVIAEGGADVVGWREWFGCLDLPRELGLEMVARASFSWPSGFDIEIASASEPLSSRIWEVLYESHLGCVSRCFDCVLQSAFIDLHSTLQAQPMVLYHCLCTTVIARYPSFRVLKLGGHWLGLNDIPQLPKLPFHVDDTSAADWTFIGGFHMFLVAS